MMNVGYTRGRGNSPLSHLLQRKGKLTIQV